MSRTITMQDLGTISYEDDHRAEIIRLSAHLAKLEAVERLMREYIEPWRRDEGWRATEWQERVEYALAALDGEETQ
jgi:hypothetical protein